METNETSNAKSNKGQGLNSVREKALRQNKVRLHKTEAEHCDDLPRQSMQKIKTLKTLSNEAQREMEDLPDADASMLDRAWDWFQRSIGNR